MWSLDISGHSPTDPSEDDLALAIAALNPDDPNPEATQAKIAAARQRVEAAHARSAALENEVLAAVQKALKPVLDQGGRYGVAAYTFASERNGAVSNW